jgi:hypothetical protein
MQDREAAKPPLPPSILASRELFECSKRIHSSERGSPHGGPAMRNLKYLLAAAALGSLAALPQSSSASPLVTGLTGPGSATSEITDGLVQKVHGYHCGKRKGWYRGDRRWHRHSRACKRRYYDDDDDYYYPRRSYYRPHYYQPYYYRQPYIAFQFGGGHFDDD